MLLIDALIPVIAVVTQTLSVPTAAKPQATTGSPFTAPPDVTVPVRLQGSENPFAPIPAASVASERFDAIAPAPLPSPSHTPTDKKDPSSPESTLDGSAQASALSAALSRQIEIARQNARNSNVIPSEFESALFAVLAWADETLVSAVWAGAPHWPRHLLQRHHFNTTTAGVAFYSRLDDLRENQGEVREVYALCLLLGFKGRYVKKHLARQLEERRRTTVQQVLDRNGLPGELSTVLFPGAYETTDLTASDALPMQPADRRARWRLRRGTLVGFGLPALVLTVLYLTYHLVIVQMVNDMLPKIQ